MIVDPKLQLLLEAILRSIGHDPRAAAAGWRSEDPFVVAYLFAAFGYRVFPCNEFKHPMVRHGVKTATSSLWTLRYWARTVPAFGWCVATGRYDNEVGPAGLWGFDIDGAVGYARRKELEAILGPLPKTWTTISGREEGGEHMLYAAANCGPDMKSVGPALILGKRQKIDQRGRGGYLVGAGSRHKNGNRYRWADGCAPDETPLACLPPAWVEAIDKVDVTPPKLAAPCERRTSLPPDVRRNHKGGGTLIGDAPGHSGFNDPIYKNALLYFFKNGIEAPAEAIIEALRAVVIAAPKDHGRDISRYLSGPDLPRIVDRARIHVTEVKEKERVESPEL